MMNLHFSSLNLVLQKIRTKNVGVRVRPSGICPKCFRTNGHVRMSESFSTSECPELLSDIIFSQPFCTCTYGKNLTDTDICPCSTNYLSYIRTSVRNICRTFGHLSEIFVGQSYIFFLSETFVVHSYNFFYVRNICRTFGHLSEMFVGQSYILSVRTNGLSYGRTRTFYRTFVHVRLYEIISDIIRTDGHGRTHNLYENYSMQ